MSLLDIFKKKKKPAGTEVAKPESKKKEGKVLAEPVKPARPAKISKKTSSLAWEVLVQPHITEKATNLEKENKYVFKVFKKANKTEVKKAVEGLYGVSVLNVKIINIPRKKRRVRRKTEGFKKGYKKAIVRLRQGDKIEIMPR